MRWTLVLIAIGPIYCSIGMAQCSSITTKIVWPTSPKPVATCIQKQSKATCDTARRQAAEAFRRIEAEQSRISAIIRAEKLKQFVAEQKAKMADKPLERDDYKKYLEEKKMMEEDPLYAEMKAPKDDYKAWKNSANYRPPIPTKAKEADIPVMDLFKTSKKKVKKKEILDE